MVLRYLQGTTGAQKRQVVLVIYKEQQVLITVIFNKCSLITPTSSLGSKDIHSAKYENVSASNLRKTNKYRSTRTSADKKILSG